MKINLIGAAFTFLTSIAFAGTSEGNNISYGPFDTSQDHLPPHYIAGNIKSAIANLSKSKNKIKKDEFETKEQYRERVENIEENLNNGEIAFSAVVGHNSGVEAHYDADDGKIYVNLALHSIYPSDSPSVRVFGILGGGRVSRRIGSYTGANAYGATADVEVFGGQTYGLAFTEADARNLIGAAVMKDSYLYAPHYSDIGLDIPVQPDEAKKLISNIGVLFIGKLRAPFTGENERVTEATFSNPTEYRQTYRYVHFNLRQIWLYDYRSGAILDKTVLPSEDGAS